MLLIQILTNETQLCGSMLDRPWEPMSGNLSSDRSQYTIETFITEGPFFGEQRSGMAGKVCLSEDMLDVCDHGWGNCWKM